MRRCGWAGLMVAMKRPSQSSSIRHKHKQSRVYLCRQTHSGSRMEPGHCAPVAMGLKVDRVPALRLHRAEGGAPTATARGQGWEWSGSCAPAAMGLKVDRLPALRLHRAEGGAPTATARGQGWEWSGSCALAAMGRLISDPIATKHGATVPRRFSEPAWPRGWRRCPSCTCPSRPHPSRHCAAP